MELRINFNSGVPIYQQLMEQIKHAVATRAVHAGEQLPTIRKLAEELAMNPNTAARAYRELEREGVIEVRHGSGAYVAEAKCISRAAALGEAGQALRQGIKRGLELGLTEPELRRVFENELALSEVAQTTGRRQG